jgi:hypothetical protein
MEPLQRRDFLKALCGIGAGLTVVAVQGSAFAEKKAKVEWTEVELPADPRKAAREHLLRSVLSRESHRVSWGQQQQPLELAVKVTEFEVIKRADVVRVTCAAVGKMKNGPSVKTRFSFGGDPRKQEQLESHVLTLIAQGVVNRLAAIAREKAKRA